MKNINHPFSFKLLTAWVFVVHAIACSAGYLILGRSPFIDGPVLGLMLLIDLSFVVALVMATERNVAPTLILAWFALLFFCVRLAVLLLFPLSAIDFLTGGVWTSDEIFKGLVFITLGFVAILLGIFTSSRFEFKSKLLLSFKGKQVSLWALTAYWAITYLAAYYVRIYLEVTIFGAPQHWGNRMAWVGIIFDTDVALVLTICWGTIEWRRRGLKKLEVIHLVFLVAAWLIFSVVIGSRGGPLRVLSWIFFAALAVNPNFKLSVVRFLVVLAAFFIVNAYAYQMGSMFRAYHLGATDGTSSVDGFKVNSKEKIALLEANVSELRRSYYRSELLNDAALRVRPIATRLAIIDYPLTIITRPGNQEVLDHYVRSWHPVKNFINNMVPGEIFKDAMVNTSRIFTMAYRDRSLQAISEGYMSEPWTMWGMAWLLAGYGGLAIMFGVAFVLQAGYRLLDVDANGVGAYVRCIYFIIPLNIAYQMFGIDHWLTAVMHFSLASSIAYVTMLGIDRIFTKFRARPQAIEPANK